MVGCEVIKIYTCFQSIVVQSNRPQNGWPLKGLSAFTRGGSWRDIWVPFVCSTAWRNQLRGLYFVDTLMLYILNNYSHNASFPFKLLEFISQIFEHLFIRAHKSAALGKHFMDEGSDHKAFLIWFAGNISLVKTNSLATAVISTIEKQFQQYQNVLDVFS